MISIIICDDDIVMLNKIKSVIECVLSETEKKARIHSFSDAMQISDQLLSICDIALLDIDFDNADYNGMDIAKRLRALRKDTVIIFVTNFIEYAPTGYEVQAFRYVLKKDIPDDLINVFRLALKQLNKETLKIQINGEAMNIPSDDILYLEVMQHCVTAFVQTGKSTKEYSFYASLSELEQRLESQGFLRIHKSYLVNMKHLKKFQCREATLDNGMILRVSEKNYAENKQKYLLWKGWQ